jgi:hypothetical protein
MSTLNWSDLVNDAGSAATSYEPLPDGDYDLKVLEATTTTSATGKTMFKVKAEVQTGPHAKRLVWDNLVISPENPTALGIFFSKMAALGLPREFFTNNNPTNAQIEAQMTGKFFRATIGTRVYQGNKSNEIRRYHMTDTSDMGAPTPSAAPPAPPVAAAPPPPPAAPAPASPFEAPPAAPF